MNIGSMTPARVTIRPGQPEWLASGRLWQGIPGIERTKGGRLFALWYSGGKTEEPGNVIVLETSDDGGVTWTDGFCVIHHDDASVRCFDPCVWIDPLGRLWVFWAQSKDFYDGRAGVWCALCRDPDGEIGFTSPRRLFDGVMINKPIAQADGAWLFPTSLWSRRQIVPSEEHPELEGKRLALVAASRDCGQTFEILGGADVPNRSFDEHMLIALADGRLWMTVRAHTGIGQAFSRDGGRTWTDGGAFLPGPDSRFFIRRLRSGRILLVTHMNPTGLLTPGGFHTRDNLIAVLSEDDGRTWRGALVIDARQGISYPDATEAENGDIYLIYDRERYGAREILMAVFTEEDILEGMIVSPRGRLRQPVSRAAGER